MIAHVVAFEYCNGTSAGGGGFDWFPNAAEAESYYAERVGLIAPNEAWFRFDVEFPNGTSRDTITDSIDDDLIDHTAAATRRAVGADVLAYWLANEFNMGDATSPARANSEGVQHNAN